MIGCLKGQIMEPLQSCKSKDEVILFQRVGTSKRDLEWLI